MLLLLGLVVMKRGLIWLLLTVLSLHFALAQHTIGAWQSLLSYHNATMAEPAGHLIYAVGNGGLYAYDKDDQSVHCYWKSTPLSDTDIVQMIYNKPNKTLVLIYANGNIDLLVNDEQVYNIPDYMNKNMTTDKSINSLSTSGDFAYLSTMFGIVKINLKRKEITDTYQLNSLVHNCIEKDGRIHAATDKGLYVGNITDNLLDAANWQLVTNKVFNRLEYYKGVLIGSSLNDGLYTIGSDNDGISYLLKGDYSYLRCFSDKLIASNDGYVALFHDINAWSYLWSGLDTRVITYENGCYWAACNAKGLMGFTFNKEDNLFAPIVNSITPNSPKRNWIDHITSVEGGLLIAGGGSAANSFNRPGTIMMFTDGNWSSFQEEGISSATGIAYKDIMQVVQDPTDENRHYASSFGQGVYEFYKGKFKTLYNEQNSSLQSALPGTPEAKDYVRTSGLCFDADNNLWVTNSESKYGIHVLTPAGQWIPLTYSSLKPMHTLRQSLIDRNGNYWCIASMEFSMGVFALNHNGTINNQSDDREKFVESFDNQDGNSVNHKGFNCMVEDLDGTIWMGTGQGVILLTQPQRFFEEGYRCTQIKVARNDGTNLADFLLANDNVLAIAVDAANRKWLGTESNGIYLVTPDGQETVHHFTKENSPLPDNTITAISIDHKSGDVYMGTGKGLVAYRSDAVEGAERFEKSEVYTYPNPVKPDYDGVITVTGMMRDSDVKIVNVSGSLIYQGQSLGGQFVWNGRNRYGERVASGVYFVVASDKEGNEGVITKIVMIK